MSDIEPIAWMSKTGAKTLSRKGFLTVGKREDADRTVPIYGPEAADEINRLRTLLSEADQREKDARRVTLEEAAKVAEGDVYKDRYRTWPWMTKDKWGNLPNLANDDGTTKHSDKIAAAIRALQSEER